MSLDVANQQNTGRIAGKTVLFIGNECRYWTLDKWAYAARVAHSLGIDSISAKLMNGTQKWYGTPANLVAIYKTVAANGCGFIPFGYCYGPLYGIDFVNAECAVLAEMQEAIASTQPDGIGFVCADLETEWNGRVDAAQRFNAAMQNKHLLYLTSWANPGQQAWEGVLNVLRGCINAYIPQAYNDYLSSAEYQQVAQDICIQSAVDLSYEFGDNNHPATIAQNAIAHGQTTVWIWEWVFLGSFKQNIWGVVQAMKGVHIDPVPVPTPQPAPQPTSPPQPTTTTYEFQNCDTMDGTVWGHARDAGFKGDAAQLVADVLPQLDHFAVVRGHPNSNNGNLIWAGDTITFPI